MRKISLMVLFIFTLMLMQGCQLLVLEEDTDEYRKLSDQYNEYVMHDVINFDDFKKVMNNATNLSNTSVFMVETDALDLFNRVTSAKHGTGLLIFKDSSYHFILTTFQMIDLANKRVNYFVNDAYGNQLNAEIFAADSKLGLGILRVPNVTEVYAIAEFANYMPLSNELVLMISNSYPTQNIHKLGFYLYQDELSYMKVVSSQNANGSPIFNLKLEVIGIQFAYGEEYIQIIDFQTIDDFVRPLLPI